MVFSHRLVRKFFTRSTPPSLEETEHSLQQQWQEWVPSTNDMTFQKLDDDSDKFLFSFIHEEDKYRVYRMGPFYVNGALLVPKNPSSSDDVTDFTVTSFAIAVVGLPSYLFNNDYLPTLKSKVGEFNPTLVQKPYTDNDVYLFGAKVDLKKPFRPGFYISETRFVEFK